MSNDGELRVVAERDDQLVNHKSEDTHHGGTAVVELDGTLGELGLLVEAVPAEVDVSVAEVSRELSVSWNLTHERALQNADGGDDLHDTRSRDVALAEDGGNAVRVGGERMAAVVDVSRKVDSSTGGDLAEEGKHADAAVLDLNVPKAGEALLVDISAEHAEGIEVSERGLDSEFLSERAQRGGGGLLGGRGEGGGASEQGCNNSELHLGRFR